jgi:diacylglycerol kinase (ATP)
VGLVVNPTAGKGRGTRVHSRVAGALAAVGLEPVDLSGADVERAVGNARAGLTRGLDALVVVGGDGMVHLGVNALAGTGVPLGIVAVGSGNDVARDLDLPVGDVEASVAVVRDALADPAGVRRLDAVAVSRPGGPTAHWYMASLSCGLDAAVNERANTMSWPAGGARYVRALLAELGSFRPYGYRVTLDGQVWQGEGTLVVVANTPSFGGGMRIAPDAEPDDGLLDVVLARGLSRTALLRLFPRIYPGTHLTHPAVEVRRARSVLVEPLEAVGARPPTAFADGERLDDLPLQCDVHPGAVGVLVRRP